VAILQVNGFEFGGMGMMTGKRLSVIAALLTTIGLGICLRGTVSTVHDRNSRFSGDTGASNSSLLASDRYYDFATASHLASAALPQAGVAEDGRHRFHFVGPSAGKTHQSWQISRRKDCASYCVAQQRFSK
jgi:hypothetical protein